MQARTQSAQVSAAVAVQQNRRVTFGSSDESDSNPSDGNTLLPLPIYCRPNNNNAPSLAAAARMRMSVHLSKSTLLRLQATSTPLYILSPMKHARISKTK